MAFTLKNIAQKPQNPTREDLLLQTMSDSAADFLHVVWPRIAPLAIVGGGSLQPVEAVAKKPFKEQLDLLAGIDAWHIQTQPSAIRGLASRVQWGAARRTFTIRTRSQGGGETELEKRARAIANQENGHLFPHLTVQAYLDKKQGNLLCAAVIKTTDLIGRATFLQKHMKHNNNLYGYQDNADGSQFMYIAWDYLSNQKCAPEIIQNQPHSSLAGLQGAN